MTELTDECVAFEKTVEELETVKSSSALCLQAVADEHVRLCLDNESLLAHNSELIGVLKEVLGTVDVVAGQTKELETI